MAVPNKSRKPRSSTQKNQYSAELTSGQLVMGITILMIFGLACFLLGVLIGKVDPSMRDNQVQIAQTSQRGEIQRNEPKDTAPEIPKPEIVEKTIIAKPDPAPKQPVQPTNTVPQEAPVESSDLPPTAPKPAPMPEPKPEPAPAPKVIVKEEPIKPEPKVSPPPAPTPASTNKGGWYVQIGAFKELANAQKEKKRIESTYPHPITVMKPAGSSLHKLLIGTYPNKAAADKVRQELLPAHPGLILHQEAGT